MRDPAPNARDDGEAVADSRAVWRNGSTVAADHLRDAHLSSSAPRTAAIDVTSSPDVVVVPELPAVDPPEEMEMHRVRRRILQIAALAVAVGLVVALVPGLAGVRTRVEHGTPGWLAAVVAFQLMSSLSYVAAFRSAFCPRMRWGMSYLIGMSELAANSLLPAAGAGGLALGAWALRRGGLPVERIARRTVAFVLVTSAANVAALALAGLALAAGLVASDLAWPLTLGPAAAALAAVALALLVPRLGHRGTLRWERAPGRLRRRIARSLAAGSDGVGEAVTLLRSGNPLLVGGAVGYLAFDIAALWAAFRAFGDAPPVAILLIAYLIGQLGGLIPVPGGIGGVDGGLIGALAVYGVPLMAATAAVLIYRAVLLWLPALLGGVALARLRRRLDDEPAPRFPCAPGVELVPEVELGSAAGVAT